MAVLLMVNGFGTDVIDSDYIASVMIALWTV